MLKLFYVAPWEDDGSKPTHTFLCFVSEQEPKYRHDRQRYLEAYNEIIEWCTDQFGPRRMDGLWNANERGYFWINDESCAMLFKVRWV